MVLKDYLRIVRRILPISLLAAYMGAAAGLIGCYEIRLLGVLPYFPLYTATATVMVGGDVGTVQGNLDYTTLSKEFTGTYAALVNRQPIMEGVIQQLGLKISPEKLAKQVTGVNEANTQLIDITVNDPDPVMVARIANATADQLIVNSPQRVRNFVLPVSRAKSQVIPNLLFIMISMVAGLLGLLAVGGVAFLITFLRNPVFSGEELNQTVKLPILATARPMRRPQSWRQWLSSLGWPAWRKTNESVWWPLAQECERRFQALALPTNPHRPLPRILVTSPTEDSKAKAVVAINLATAWARGGSKVTLIDADLVSPVLHSWFKLPASPGYAELLCPAEDDKLLQAALRPTSVPNLTLLAAGDRSRRAQAVPTRDSLQHLLNELAECSDVVVLLAPPVLTSGDATLMASVSHGVVLVLTVGETPLESTSDARDALVMSRDNLWGAVLADDLKTK